MPDVLLDPELLAVLVIAALGLSLVLAVWLVVSTRRLAALRREHAQAFPDSAEDVVAVLSRHTEQLATVREDITTIHSNTERLRDLLRGTVSRIGLVRYDAFEDMGGALSFSAALLDEHGTGLVISAINGRSETRSYGKPVVAGASEHHLSHEEAEAISAAIDGRAPSTLQPEPRRKRRAS
jgi:hypothetical protein